MKPHASPSGVETLDRQQKDITDSWNNVTELSNDRHLQVSAAVEHSEKFLVNLENFEKWLRSNSQSLTSLGEIYTDDVPNTLEKFEVSASLYTMNYSRLVTSLLFFHLYCFFKKFVVISCYLPFFLCLTFLFLPFFFLFIFGFFFFSIFVLNA